MKFKFLNIAVVTVLFSTLALTSCLKDGSFDSGQSQPAAGGNINVIGITLTATSTSNFLTLAFDGSSNDTVINLIPVSLAGTGPAAEDIHVTLTQNDKLVADYDTANGTDYIPPTAFTLLNGGVVTIPKGSYTGYLQIKAKTNDFAGADYALGFTITKIQESGYVISGNFSNGIVAIGAKNTFDGEYTVSGSFIDNYTTTITDDGVYPIDAFLITVGPNSDKFYDNGNSIFGKLINSSGSFSYYGGFDPVFTIDPTTGDVTSVANALLNDGSNVHHRDAALDPAGINKFNFATKELDITYDMIQPDIAPGFVRAVFTETYTYVGPR